MASVDALSCYHEKVLRGGDVILTPDWLTPSGLWRSPDTGGFPYFLLYFHLPIILLLRVNFKDRNRLWNLLEMLWMGVIHIFIRFLHC